MEGVIVCRNHYDPEAWSVREFPAILSFWELE
jgi:hypothetical protein